MKRTLISIAVLLITRVAIAAGPTIESVTPSHGDVAGGLTVTIRGASFHSCVLCSPPYPPEVWFGGTQATTTRLLSDTEIEAVTPVHLPGAVDVAVVQQDGVATAPDAFMFAGDMTAVFDTILIPTLTGPLPGAWNSIFETTLLGWNDSDDPLPVWGASQRCLMLCPPSSGAPDAEIVSPHTYIPVVTYTGSPGRLLYVPKGRTRDLLLNLRVFDTSRKILNFGTQIPVVRESEFRPQRILMLGVPYDGINIRNTLRIYSATHFDTPIELKVSIDNVPLPSGFVTIRPGATLFDPAYAEVSFPGIIVGTPPAEPVLVRVEVGPTGLGTATMPYVDLRLWAFVTVTNNATQTITTIAPH